MQSLKTKFTILITGTLFIVVIIFAGLLYSSLTINNLAPLSQERLEEIAGNRPPLKRLIQNNKEIARLTELGERIQEEQAKRYRRTLIVFLPVTLLIAAGIGYVASSNLVKPIEKLSTEISKIGSRNLSKRLSENQSSEEIELLTKKFNYLLDELEASFTSQERFMQDAAHELRTPLTAIKTNIEIFNDSTKKKRSDYEHLIELTERLNKRLINLSEKLLLLNHRTGQKLNLQQVNLNDLVEDVLENLSGKIHESGGKVSLNPGDLDKLRIDPEKISIVIQNLVENSIKYTKKDPEINISTKQRAEFVILRICDNGIGIPAADLPNIFNRFFRASNTDQLGANGEGLGLSIVEKIIRDHGGSISVESKLHKGTVFTVNLPL